MKKFYALSIAILFSVSVFAAGHTVSVSSTAVTCFGSCDGAATAVVGGGVGPFTYSWVPSGGSAASATGLCAGNYTVTVTDNADMSTETGTVTVGSPAVLNVTASGGMVCSGACITLTTTVTGGTGACAYNWTPASSLSSTTIGNPTACPTVTTTYTVTVADMNGCIDWTAVTVTVSSPPTITVTPTYDICAGGCVSISASGAFTYFWAGPGGFSSATCCPAVCPTTTTTYTVTGTGPGGCSSTATTTVNILGPITTAISSTNNTNCTTTDGTATVAAIGGVSPYMHDWQGALSPAGDGTDMIFNMPAGMCYVNITDAAGCSTMDSVMIFNANSVAANFTAVPDSTDAFNFFFFNSSTGAGNTYLWDFGDGAVSSAASPSHAYGTFGVMNICLYVFNSVCGDDTLCTTLSVTGVLSSCESLFNIADDTLNPDPNAHYVYNLSYGATLSYLWDFGDGTTSTSATPSHVYASTGPYLLCLSIDNGSGCTDIYCDSLISADSLNRSSGQLEIVVYNVPPFQEVTTSIEKVNSNVVSVYPNPFSENTTFVISNKVPGNCSFELYDMMGKKVMNIQTIAEKKFEISRNGLAEGCYFYRIQSAENLVGSGKLMIK